MRFVIHGAGGIGATIGGRLHQSGHDVVLLARGAHGEALRTRGLRLASPGEDTTLAIPAYTRPDEVDWRAGDLAILAMKGQDTESAARDLVAAAGPALPVVSAQNGVANERTLARYFAQVHAICVMCPTAHLEPGMVVAHSAPVTGLLDIGRFPEGVDEVDEAVAAALRASRFESMPRTDVMRWKYRKLVNNLGNAVRALCGEAWDDHADACEQILAAEADACFAVAGIAVASIEDDRERRGSRMNVQQVGSMPRGGGSTWQSLARGSGVETDHLNGEVALMGRLYGVPTPANARIQRLMREAAAAVSGPGSYTPARLLAALRKV